MTDLDKEELIKRKYLIEECKFLVLKHDPDLGYERWYCGMSQDFLFDTQECNSVDCAKFKPNTD